MPLFFGHNLRLWILCLACLFMTISFTVPKIFEPLNFLWTIFGSLLHKITSPIALGAIYFFVVTPIGVFMRLIGKDLLQIKINKKTLSYWKQRYPSSVSTESFKNLF